MTVKNILTFLFKETKTTIQHSSPKLAMYNETRNMQNRSSLCYAPSVNMLFAQDGKVRVCCHNLEQDIGKYPEQSIQQIWNSKKAKQIRDNMTNYTFPSGCAVCKRKIDIGGFDFVSAKHFDSLPIHPEYPTMMEFLLSNTCNLECEMCQGDYSSLIRKNREKLPPLISPYNVTFIEQLSPFLSHLTEARFSGSGEAFAIDIYYELWEKLLLINPNCKIVIQTNGTILNQRIKDLVSRGNFEIGVSLDSLEKEKFETIRKNASFDRVMENITFFSNYSKDNNKMFLIAVCVMRNNWDEMPAFVKCCNKIGAYVNFHQVLNPQHLSLATLSSEKLESIYQQLKQYTFETTDFVSQKNTKHYYFFLDVILNWIEDAKHREKLIPPVFSLIELSNKFQNQINEIKSSFVESEIQLFNEKFNKILNSFESEEQKIVLFKKALDVETATLVSAILKYPDEYLEKEAFNIFKI